MDSCLLPLEVVDLILDQLELDFRALRSCSAVCRSWLPSCRSHLFRHLELRHAGRGSPEKWNDFFLASPHILSYIQELAVLCERSSWVSWDPVLPTLLGKFPNLRQIELHGCDLPWLPARLSSAIYTLFRSPLMKRVSLRLCVLPSSCFDLFGPALQNIALSDVVIDSDVTAPLGDEESPSARPKRLTIEGKVSTIVDWLIPSSERNELEDLEHLCLKYQGDDVNALHAVECLLQRAGSLKALDISLHPATLQSALELCPAPNICYNQQIRELRLSHFDMDISSPTNQLPWLGSLLSQMTTRHSVQKITLDARHRPCLLRPILDQNGLANVDDILFRMALPCLRDVHIQVGNPYSASFDEISASMPLLCAKGILTVSM
ncbi:hypothetical protein MSAN_00401700 [Mycena sanguinolenta]|uniref:F-box domain-containing protein n=1 Tax=Mycena sanguinolenta TaxID=230812 RepID=A0A8H6ZCJ6_9AGAR|nr:hypothetical protein MSAN_00401700 [Mycena sanguinolenta]